METPFHPDSGERRLGLRLKQGSLIILVSL